MRYTYYTYLFNRDMERYAEHIEVIEMRQMDLGAWVRFYCDDEAIVEEIFAEEEA